MRDGGVRGVESGGGRWNVGEEEWVQVDRKRKGRWRCRM